MKSLAETACLVPTWYREPHPRGYTGTHSSSVALVAPPQPASQPAGQRHAMQMTTGRGGAGRRDPESAERASRPGPGPSPRPGPPAFPRGLPHHVAARLLACLHRPASDAVPVAPCGSSPCYLTNNVPTTCFPIKLLRFVRVPIRDTVGLRALRSETHATPAPASTHAHCSAALHSAVHRHATREEVATQN